MRTQRLERIESFIHHHQAVTLDVLCDTFKVSKNTIRRDIDEIIKGGAIEKTYGGVRVVKDKSVLPPFVDRTIQNIEIKKQIARTACDYVQDGDIIFVDSGTTTCHMAEWLYNKRVTVLTNNLEFLIQVLPYSSTLRVFGLLGMLNTRTLSFTGLHTLELLKTYNISKAFMAATGLSAQAGMTNTLPDESAVKKLVVERSEAIYLLADSTKFDRTAMLTYCTFKQLDALITDKKPSGELFDALQQYQVDIVLAQ